MICTDTLSPDICDIKYNPALRSLSIPFIHCQSLLSNRLSNQQFVDFLLSFVAHSFQILYNPCVDKQLCREVSMMVFCLIAEHSSPCFSSASAMVRRSTCQLQTIYHRRIMRPISPSDGFGWLYAYVDWGGEWKIGMTSDFRRRQQQWEQCCPRPRRIWFGPIAVANRRRAGKFFVLFLFDPLTLP